MRPYIFYREIDECKVKTKETCKCENSNDHQI